MSVLVKGMDMPRCCRECPFYTTGGCMALMVLFWDGFNIAARQKECPLIEVDETTDKTKEGDKK